LETASQRAGRDRPTATQEFVLLSHARSWAASIQRLQVWDDDRGHGFLDAHMLALALIHLQNCLDQLAPVVPSYARAAVKLFRRALGSDELRRLRNGLEHEEEYLRGRGANRNEMVSDHDSWPIDESEGSWSTTLLGTGDRLVGIRLLGRNYDLAASLDGVRELVPVLERWYRSFLTWLPPETEPSEDDAEAG
jgi:hypothetical protein